MLRKILIADDNVINRELLKNMLGREYDVLEAENGRQALEVMHRNYKVLSAVLLDIFMPEMNGYEVLSVRQSSALLAQIPVIVVTGSDSEDSRVRALSLGANDFVMHPYNPEILMHCLRNNIQFRENASVVNALRRDHLTGIYSREAFFSKAEELIRSDAPGSYVITCFDIDNFKLINDQHGTQEGDRILQHIGREVKRVFDEVGGICGRITGDIFAGVYPNTTEAERKISTARRERMTPPDTKAVITYSVGRYIINDTSHPLSAMYDRAFIAKQSVKGMYDKTVAYFDKSMLERMLQEQRVTVEMGEAVERQQFEVWYQPQMNHSTGALIGAEALVRWRHPMRGLISPADFIPLFERNGFIYELDKYVWERVCADLRRWLDTGRETLPVSVNISRYDILREDLIDVINGLVERYSIPVALLRLEITESAFANSAKDVIEVVERLRSFGYTVEIDDFGSGYSSLNTLKDVPADVLKLDMKFLEDDGDSQRGGNIVESVVRMAKWLGMAVLAEGVETIQQADFLKSIGCNYMQGYLYAAPMPAEQYEQYCDGIGREEKMMTLETVENMDNNAFWNPKSMDTLIFNSYVGGACIFEYYKQSVEVLRTNEKFVQMLGEGTSVEDVLKLDWINSLDRSSRERLIAAIERSKLTREEVTDEYLFENLPGVEHKIYLRSTMRVIASAGERHLVYVASENITAQRIAEQRVHDTAAQLQAITDNINGGVTASIIRGEYAQIVFANSCYYSQLGYTAQQYAQEVEHPFQLIHPDDRERVINASNAVDSLRASYSIRYRVYRRDGALRYFVSNISMVNLPDIDEPVQLAVANDVTEEYEAKLSQKDTAAQLQAILDNVSSGITAFILKKHAEMLFANDKFYDLLGYTREQYSAEVDSIFSVIVEQDRERVKSELGELKRPGENYSTEFCARRRNGSVIWIACRLSIASLVGYDAPVRITIYTDISEEKRALQEMHETDERLRFLNDTAHILLSSRDSNEGINTALKKLLDYFAGARAYIFELDYERRTAENTYEVCAQGVSREIENLKSVSFETLCFWMDRFESGENVFVQSADELDEARLLEREVLRSQGVQTLIAVPLRRDGRLIGFAGIDDPGQNSARVSHLNALGDYLSVMLTRRDMQDKIDRDRSAIVSLMNDTPGGFMRARMTDDGQLLPEYCNEGFLRLVDMSFKQFSKLCNEQQLGGVHPDDVGVVTAALEALQQLGEVRSERFRLRRGSDGYVWTMFFGRRVNGDNGQVFYNTYYTDMNEQVKAIEAQRELLDNLPCGATLFVSDGQQLRNVYLNARYNELAVRRHAMTGAASIDMVHPEDRELVSLELRSAIRQQRDAACDVRIVGDDGVYRPFHISAHIHAQSDSKYAVYATYTPISEQAMSIQQMLPIALAAMMESSPDYSFIKDSQLRYVCCTRAFAQMVGLPHEKNIVGLTDYDIFEKRLADKYNADDRQLMQSGESINNTVEEIPSLDERQRFVSTSKYLLKDAAGNVIGMYGYGRDITAALEQESQLKLLTDNMPGGIAVYESRLGAPETLRLCYFSDGYCRLFGYTRSEFEEFCAESPLGRVSKQDMPRLLDGVQQLMQSGELLDGVYRANRKDGSQLWLNVKASVGERHGDFVRANAVLFDVTEQHQALERLRISEETNRIAVRHTGHKICSFNIATRTLSFLEPEQGKDMPRIENDLPDGPIERGDISPDTAAVFGEFYNKILRGEKTGNVVYKLKMQGDWRWIEAYFTCIFAPDGRAVSAVISYNDITEQMEKEAVFKKWQQSLQDKDPATYTFIRCNLSRGNVLDSAQGLLLGDTYGSSDLNFDERTERYVSSRVHRDDRRRYRAFLNTKALLEGYRHGRRARVLEYREALPAGGFRWLQLSIDLVEYPNSQDIEIYMMYEDIDSQKRQQLLTEERAEHDGLTGVLNRDAFTERMNELIKLAPSGTKHALLMFDLDGFKLVNDAFGHNTGDRELIKTAKSVQSVLRAQDLFGRLGGDEFIVFCNDTDEDAAALRAQEICRITRREFGEQVHISASVGVAVCPRDGRSFNTLYKKADAALYYVKGSHKGDYAFYTEGEMPLQSN